MRKLIRLLMLPMVLPCSALVLASACGGNDAGGPAPDGAADASTSDATAVADAAADSPPADASAAGVDASADDATSDVGASDSLAACTKPGNHALRFSGAQGIDVVRTTALEPLDLTIEAWVSFSAFGSYSTIVAKGYGPTIGDSYALWHNGSALHGGIPATIDDSVGYSWLPTAGTWHHVAVTYNHASGAQQLYVDGVAAAAQTTTHQPVYDAHDVYIGVDSENAAFNGWFKGDIDEVTFWNVERTAAQIEADRHTCTFAPQPGLIGYWSFDEGDGQVAMDGSGNGNHGRLGLTTAAEPSDPVWVPSAVPF